MRSAIWNLDLFFGLSCCFPVLSLRISQLRAEVQFFVRLFLHLRKFHLGELHQREDMRGYPRLHKLPVVLLPQRNCLLVPAGLLNLLHWSTMLRSLPGLRSSGGLCW